MKQNIRNLTVVASTFVVAALLSVGWSQQSGLSLSIGKAEARIGRPLTPVSVAGVARRHYRRAAVGTAVAAGAASTYYAGDGYTGEPYADGSVRGSRAAYYGAYASDASHVLEPHSAVRAYYAGGPWHYYSGWDDYAARNGIKCAPGTMITLDDGLMYVCQ